MRVWTVNRIGYAVLIVVAATTGSAHALSVGGLTNATKHALFESAPVVSIARVWNCMWHQNEASDDNTVVTTATGAVDLSALLEGDERVRTYPAFPHSPVIVGASSCQNVVLRWKSFDDSVWPIDKYILQRYPDFKHRREWTTLVETNETTALLDTFPDANVRPGKQYTYRVQAISRNVSSAYAFHQVVVSQSTCSGVLFGLLPSWSLLNHWSCEALRTLCLIVLCFLTVYGLMRANVKRMQGTRSRNYRLKRIHKSAAENAHTASKTSSSVPAGATASPSLTHRSSSESSTSPLSEPLEQSSRRSMVDSVSDFATRDSYAQSSVDLQRESSANFDGAHEKASCCQNCQKRFGIFRRRHMCDICHAVTLCRKCGYQAPSDGLVGFTRATAASIAFDDLLDVSGRRSSLSRDSVSEMSQRKVKIKTICRGCCEEVYRYSTASSMRPSHFAAPQ